MRKKRKLIIILVLLFLFLTLPFYFNTIYANAITGNEGEIESNLNETLLEQLNHFDFSGLDNLLEDLKLTGSLDFVSFKDKVVEIINGEFKEGYTSVFEAIVGLLLQNIVSFVPLFALIISIGLLSSFVSNLTPNTKNKTITDIVHFVCYSLIIIVVFSQIVSLTKLTGNTLNSLKTQIDLIFPILLTIMTSLGSVAAVSVYQPAVAIFSGTIVQLFSNIIMPLFIFTLVFNVVGNLSTSLKLKKFHEFFNSSFKWLIGTTFTIFTAFLSIQGITASSYDTVSIKTAKFAMRSYIPILGGYLSDGFNVIMASGVLIKNAVGLVGLVIMFFTILTPIVQIVILKLGFNLTAAILEPIVDKRISDFIMAVSKTLIMLLCTILAVAFMYLIIIGLIVSTANLI